MTILNGHRCTHERPDHEATPEAKPGAWQDATNAARQQRRTEHFNVAAQVAGFDTWRNWRLPSSTGRCSLSSRQSRTKMHDILTN